MQEKKKGKMVPMYSAADFFAGKKDARPVGRMSNPDEIGPVLVDRETLFRLMAERRPGGCVLLRDRRELSEQS